MKRRSGFTLIEVVVVMAIILIVGGATTVVLVEGITTTDQRSEGIEQKLDNYDVSRGQVDGWLGTPIVSGTTGDGIDPSPTYVTTTAPPPTTTAPSPTTTAPPPTTTAPPPTTTAPPPTTTAPTETTQAHVLPEPNPNFEVTTRVTSSWQSGDRTFVQYSFDIENITPGLSDWNSLVMIVPEGTQVEGFWAGTYDLEGTILTLYPYGWAERVNNRATIDIAIQLSADGSVEITEFVVT